jgi:hypothetical protein
MSAGAMRAYVHAAPYSAAETCRAGVRHKKLACIPLDRAVLDPVCHAAACSEAALSLLVTLTCHCPTVWGLFAIAASSCQHCDQA